MYTYSKTIQFFLTTITSHIHHQLISLSRNISLLRHLTVGMPLVTIIGGSCQGKEALSSVLQTAMNCVVIDEEGFGISKQNKHKGDYFILIAFVKIYLVGRQQWNI